MDFLLPTLAWIFLFFFGATIFSFLNVVIYRVPMEKSVVKGRSHCTTCNRTLMALDLVPIFSYICLRGKCRSCGEKISLCYPICESLGGIFLLLTTIVCGDMVAYIPIPTAKSLTIFYLFCLLFVITMVDFYTMEIPNGFVLALLAGVIPAWFFIPLSPVTRLVGVLSISLPLFIICLIIPNAFGGGDIKMMAAFGAVAGWQLSLLSFFIGVLVGGAFAGVLLMQSKVQRKAHIAFGPYLCLGCAISLLWGNEIIGWYLSFIF